jgi:hypothetical protein
LESRYRYNVWEAGLCNIWETIPFSIAARVLPVSSGVYLTNTYTKASIPQRFWWLPDTRVPEAYYFEDDAKVYPSWPYFDNIEPDGPM